jgi:hypothetical protein
MLAMVTDEDLECEQFDIITAFLDSKIDGGRKIYVEMPYGFGDKIQSACFFEPCMV